MLRIIILLALCICVKTREFQNMLTENYDGNMETYPSVQKDFSNFYPNSNPGWPNQSPIEAQGISEYAGEDSRKKIQFYNVIRINDSPFYLAEPSENIGKLKKILLEVLHSRMKHTVKIGRYSGEVFSDDHKLGDYVDHSYKFYCEETYNESAQVKFHLSCDTRNKGEKATDDITEPDNAPRAEIKITGWKGKVDQDDMHYSQKVSVLRKWISKNFEIPEDSFLLINRDISHDIELMEDNSPLSRYKKDKTDYIKVMYWNKEYNKTIVRVKVKDDKGKEYNISIKQSEETPKELRAKIGGILIPKQEHVRIFCNSQYKSPEIFNGDKLSWCYFSPGDLIKIKPSSERTRLEDDLPENHTSVSRSSDTDADDNQTRVYIVYSHWEHLSSVPTNTTIGELKEKLAFGASFNRFRIYFVKINDKGGYSDIELEDRRTIDYYELRTGVQCAWANGIKFLKFEIIDLICSLFQM